LRESQKKWPILGGNLTADYSSFGLQNKIAIVTGPSQGIGRVLAKHPANRHEEVRQLQAEIEGMGRKTLLLTTDVSLVADLRAMVQRAQETFGRIDILVNNAGWTCTKLALEVTEEEYDDTMAATLKSVFFACQEAARVMIPQGGGKIVNIGSNFGVVGFKTRSVYAAAKAGVHHLSRALSLEWAKQGVTVNVVAPCITETDSRRMILERPGYKEWATNQALPIGRWNQPEDLVGSVLFLCSNLSDMVVGHVLMVDGGWTIQ
jgi:NAD(P)-dependent dehydrogenase (short-subunit alcohol dehydrogenase family)